MESKKLFVGIAVVIILLAGAGYIVYAGRPVMQNQNTAPATQNTTSGTGTGTGTGTGAGTGAGSTGAGTSAVYSMSDVQSHNTKENCWSAIGGDVYDLTSWVSRHPGGERSIISLCGTDGTDAYTNQHGSSKRPKAMLVLLKIGSLKP